MLAKLLLAEPNVMLLDEPSNHLDIEATEWLEAFLAESAAAMILVSHDRYFLDRVTNRTIELFQGTVDNYTGNFSAYWTAEGRAALGRSSGPSRSSRSRSRRPKISSAATITARNTQQAEDRRKKLERIESWPCRAKIALPADGLSARLADRRHRGPRLGWPRRSSGRSSRTSSCRYPRRALGLDRPQRLRQIDAAPLPAGRADARCRHACNWAPACSVGYFDQHLSGVSTTTT